MLTMRITFYKVSNFNQISCCYTRIKFHWIIFPKAVNGMAGNQWSGGWSGSSLSGCNTRRYHGLLMAAIKPPTERMFLVSKLDETIILDNNRYELSTNDYGDALYPKGIQYLHSFKRDIFPEWIYEVAGIRLRKTVTMVYGENTTLIRYEVLKAEKIFTMQFLPLIAARGYHELQHAYNNIFWDMEFKRGFFTISLFRVRRIFLFRYPDPAIDRE